MPEIVPLPPDYGAWLTELKGRIHPAQQRAALAVNRELVLLYWQIGRDILARQGREGWGAMVIERLALDLRNAFPDIKGFSPRNLKYMRSFAQAWPDAEFVQGVLAQLPWCHQLTLLDKLRNEPLRRWYMAKAIEHNWSGAMFVAGSQSGQSAGGAGNPHHPTPDTHQLASNTHQLPSNTHQVAADTHQLLAALPAPLKARVPSAGTKPCRETLRVLIRDLCAWRAFSARELAELLGGCDHKHLVRELLSPMVHDGLLAYTIPEMENLRGQRYTRAAPSTEGTGTPP